MKRLLLAAALLLPIAVAADAASPSRAAQLTVSGDRLFLDVTVNGRLVRALLDSGAEMSILDTAAAATLGITGSGAATARGSGAATVEARFAEGVTIAAAGASLANRTVAILDLSDVASRLIGRPVPMILGRDFFDAGRWEIDMARGRVRTAARSPRGVRLPLTTERGIETMPAAIEGQPPVAAVFDLGNGSEVMVGRTYAERIGLTAPARIIGRAAGGGLGGAVTRDMVRMRELRLAGRTFRNVPATIDDSDTAADLNIGVSILRNFRISTDFPHHQLWLEPIA